RETEGTALPETAAGAKDLLESARRRLVLLDFTDSQIEALERTMTASRTVTLYSPLSGTVLMRNVTHGEKVTSDGSLFDIGDLTLARVLAPVPEYELPLVRVGQAATMTLSYLPGRSFTGKVGLIYPVLEAATRTATVRLEFANPSLDLRPEMYAEV